MTYNPYGTEEQNTQGCPVPLDEVIRQAINTELYDLHTWLPAKIVSVRSDGFVDLQPLLKRQYIDGSLISLPAIQMVPVCVPRGTDYWVGLPVAVGDIGIALFCERSLDAWMVAQDPLSPIDPKDTRKHTLSDAVFIPGIYPNTNVISSPQSDLTLHNGDSEVSLRKSGEIFLGGPQAGEPAVLGTTLVGGLNSLSTALTTFATGLNPGSLAGNAAALVVAIQAFVLQYLTTPSTNIVSQQTFLQRNP